VIDQTPSRRVPAWTFALLATLALTAAGAQDPSVEDLEAGLATQTGLERARTLAQLTDRLRGDAADQAIEYGREALELFEEFPDPEAEVATWNEMGWAFMTLGDLEQATAHAERGRERAIETDEQLGLSRALNNLGVVARRLGRSAEAIDYFSKAMRIQDALGAEFEVAGSMNNLGVVYGLDLNDYERALGYHRSALGVRERLGDKRAIALSLANVGSIYFRLGDLQRSLEHQQRALELRRELGIKFRIASSLANVAELHTALGDPDEALVHLEESIAISRETGEKARVATGLVLETHAYTTSGRPEEALTAAEEAVVVGDQSGELPIMTLSRLALASANRHLGRLTEAERWARQALSMSEEISLNLVDQSHLEISNILEGAGDYEGALAAFRAHEQAKEAYFDAERAKRTEVLSVQFETDRREREISALESQRELQELRLRNQVLVRNGILVGALLFGIVGLWVYRRRLEVNRQLEELSLRDPLTGLRNRRFFYQTVEGDLAASLREHRAALEAGTEAEGADLIFLLIDVDEFKSINDEHGHSVGDLVIRRVGETILATCRTSDVVVRWGGEEFLVLGRFVDRREAGPMAERIRSAVEELEVVPPSGRPIHRTCSIGFASFPFFPGSPAALSWERVLELADQAAYSAKGAGKNRWVGITAGESPTGEAVARLQSTDLREGVADGALILESSES